MMLITIFCLFTVSLIYMMGVFAKFSINYSFIGYKYIKARVWIEIFACVFLTEIIRYITVNAPKGNKWTARIINISLFLIFVLIDLGLARKTLNLGSFNSAYEFFSLTFCASVSKNLFLMWNTKKYGIMPSLIYRLIIDLYVYFLPVVPNINMLIESVLFLVLPFILYKVIDGLRTERKLEKAHDIVKRKWDKVETGILLLIFAILVSLVSREFKYSMIAVGSGSMTGTINKGDAIIYERFENNYLKEGDIIVFKMEDVMIVHRIHKKFFLGDEYAYITKGDFNDSADNWVVESDMIIGVVKQRIKYIAWPSVWINENY